MANRGRPRKVGGQSTKTQAVEESNSATQVLAMMNEFGLSKEDLADLMIKHKREIEAAAGNQGEAEAVAGKLKEAQAVAEKLKEADAVAGKLNVAESVVGKLKTTVAVAGRLEEVVPESSDICPARSTQDLAAGGSVVAAHPTPVVQKKSWAEMVEEEEARPGPPVQQCPSLRNWADVAKSNRHPHSGVRLPYVQPSEVISFSTEEIQEGARLWENTLVGMVVGTSPSYLEMVKFVKGNWKGSMTCKIHRVQRGLFLFDFQTEEQKNKVLQEKWHLYNKFPLLLKPWVPGINFDECFNRVPVWIQLPGLSYDLWTPKNLGKVVSYVGVPVMTDSFTARRERLAYARVMVEVPVGGEFPNSIPLQRPGGKLYHQEIIYEWKPVNCSKCGWLGHVSSQCKREEQIHKRWNAKNDSQRQHQRGVGENGKMPLRPENKENENPVAVTTQVQKEDIIGNHHPQEGTSGVVKQREEKQKEQEEGITVTDSNGIVGEGTLGHNSKSNTVKLHKEGQNDDISIHHGMSQPDGGGNGRNTPTPNG